MTPFLILDAAEAAALAAATANHGARLAPRQIAAGPLAGQWALPWAVLADPAFQPWAADLAMLVQADLAIAAAWPAAAE